ncbi:MAG: hypothetical protein IJI04_06530 [Lachnospiraceae bacterium]|nr:hypothetical protein [Lachnospiraceae bacterium]MBR3339565.1 hypothetical protein [Lachnospiraceae bacterium]
MSEDVLERIYQESLEERIIFYLAEKEKISLEKAMNIYYSSKLANRIHQGEYGIQYLDYKVLVQILCETEPDLVRIV